LRGTNGDCLFSVQPTSTLLRRLPNLQLDDVEHPDWRQTFVLRGLNKLAASW
jgi:hypothetical protein